MEIVRLSSTVANPIGRRPYEVKLASSIELAEGEGEAHAYVISKGSESGMTAFMVQVRDMTPLAR